jgi:hypothetical protein
VVVVQVGTLVVVAVAVAYYMHKVFQYLQEHRIQFQLAQAEHQQLEVQEEEPTAVIQHSAH